MPECTDDERDNSICIPQEEEASLDIKVEELNLGPECDRQKCVLPNCYCSADGTLAPGVEELGMDISEVPQMITITFNGAVTGENMNIYDNISWTQKFGNKQLSQNASKVVLQLIDAFAMDRDRKQVI